MSDHKWADPTFIYWATEREAMRKRREAGEPAPWSDDPLMAGYRYCNVSREDDRVTRWIKLYIRDPFDRSADDLTLFRAMCLARFVNHPETLLDLLTRGALSPNNISGKYVSETVSLRQKEGKTSFSSAYMVRPEMNKKNPNYGRNKIFHIMRIVEGTTLPDCSSRESFVAGLSAQDGFGTFMAGQVAADLAYTRLLRDAPDHMTWCPIGPGATRGMNLALGRDPEKSIKQDEFNEVGMRQMASLPPEIVADRELTLHDVASNCNCESFKYIRLQNGGYGRKYS